MIRHRTSALIAICMVGTSISCEQPQVPAEAAPRTPARPSMQAARPPELVNSGRLYLPIYSHIYVREGHPEDLAVTLSVRNVSMHRPLILEYVRYYDTSGKSLEGFLEAEATLQPLETVEFFVSTLDRRGGSGANVVVAWHSDSKVVKPLVEAVMVHSGGNNKAYAFATRAVEIPADPTPSADASQQPAAAQEQPTE